MEFKTISKLKVPVLGLGTWEMGGRFETDSSKRQQWIGIIKEAIELGFTHIDTSEIYGDGFTEELVGEAIQSFDRKKLFITSKLWHTHLNFSDAIESLNKSLERLRTDYVDLYLVHRPGAGMDIGQTMNAFEHMQEQNLVKSLGLSNFNNEQFEEARKYLHKSRMAALQNEYNLLKRDENGLELCNKNDMLFIAYRPLMKGVLAKPGIKVLDGLAGKYSKTQAQIALNWLVSKPRIVTIPKASSREHLSDNLGAIGWKMEKEDYEALDKMQSC